MATRNYCCVESTLDIELENYTVRLWVDRGTELDSSDFFDNSDYYTCATAYQHHDLNDLNDLVIFLADLDNVNAVQVKDKRKPNQDGVMVYCVPFDLG